MSRAVIVLSLCFAVSIIMIYSSWLWYSMANTDMNKYNAGCVAFVSKCDRLAINQHSTGELMCNTSCSVFGITANSVIPCSMKYLCINKGSLELTKDYSDHYTLLSALLFVFMMLTTICTIVSMCFICHALCDEPENRKAGKR